MLITIQVPSFLDLLNVLRGVHPLHLVSRLHLDPSLLKVLVGFSVAHQKLNRMEDRTRH
jgi:hypothetical protein